MKFEKGFQKGEQHKGSKWLTADAKHSKDYHPVYISVIHVTKCEPVKNEMHCPELWLNCRFNNWQISLKFSLFDNFVGWKCHTQH